MQNQKYFLKNYLLLFCEILITLLLCSLGCTYSFAESIIIDHTCTDNSQIPHEWIEAVKSNIKIYYAHASHGEQPMIGMERIETSDPNFSVAIYNKGLIFQGTKSDRWNPGDDGCPVTYPTEPGALNIYNTNNIAPHEYFAHEDPWGRKTTLDIHDQNPLINVSIFGWCGELGLISGTGECDYSDANSFENFYLRGMEAYEQANPNVTFVYMTGPQDAGDIYNRYQRNEQIRQWVRNTPENTTRVLFDFADLDHWWFNPNTEMWENNFYDGIPIRHPQFNEPQEAAHTTYESCIQKGKAFWWMLARIAGWNPSTGEDTTPPFISDISPASGTSGVSIHSNIFFHVQDSESGVDLGSLQLTINSTQIQSENLQITGDATDYAIVFDPQVDFDYNSLITVSVDVQDLQSQPNIMDTFIWSFTTQLPILDNCPDDPNKTEPGICGCGLPDIDTDGDGTMDCLDECPDDPNKTEHGICDCGIPDIDTDGDGTMDCLDECPNDPNKTEPGICDCGIPDIDTDGDGTMDCLDECPDDPNKTEHGICFCGVADTDSDDDGTMNCNDNCPQVYNPDQVDLDGDEIGDVCDAFTTGAFDELDLIRVVYMPGEEEVVTYLGRIGTNFNFTEKNLVFGSDSDAFQLSDFVSATGWSDLYITYFAKYHTTTAPHDQREGWLAINTNSTTPSVNLEQFNNFNEGIDISQTYYRGLAGGIKNKVIANTTYVDSYYQEMDFGGSSLGTYGGYLTPGLGEMNLISLATDDYVDMYLYYFKNDTLQNNGSPVAVIRSMADGSTIINPSHSVNMNFSPGWRMISLPVLPESTLVSDLFSEAVVVYGYAKGTGYFRVEELEFGKGYWILFNKGKTYTITGQPLFKYTSPVYEDGWEMIGGCTFPTQATTNTCNIVVIYKFTAIGYQRVLETENMMPGEGYWIMLSNIVNQAELIVRSADSN